MSREYAVEPCFTDTSLLRTVFFVPSGVKPSHFFEIQPAYYGHPVNTNTFYGPLNFRVNGVLLLFFAVMQAFHESYPLRLGKICFYKMDWNRRFFELVLALTRSFLEFRTRTLCLNTMMTFKRLLVKAT